MIYDFKKTIAATLMALTAALMIFSVAYVISEANHDCTGTDCHVCLRIELCLNNFRTLGTSNDIESLVFVVERFFEPEILVYVCLIVPVTLISCKVRLDD